ncbi:LacI family DNA-binding transcriptional regulator [Gorillibacterium sp. sgz500922]|uniref:LacI family DNA-binding transcriptional regulator n=1 Tax=Gorillibacterium sp. sgz500922 TaxID=3446694 RepID=UPI003F666322
MSHFKGVFDIASILDIAKRAGVSKTTVSKVLNHQYGVHEETRKKVWAAAEALRYTPNIAARALVTSKTGVIGVVYDSFRSPVYTELAAQLELWAQEAGYHLVFCSCNERQDAKRHYIQYFMGGAADGVILYGSSEADTPVIEHLTTVSFPFVVIENHVEQPGVPNVLVDNQDGAAQVVRYLHRLGHRDIVHVTGNLRHRVAIDRRDGFLAAMKTLALDPSPASVLVTEGTVGCGEAAARELLLRPERPTALFVFNDLIAYEMMGTLQQAGVSIPDDLSMVGFDHLAGLLSFKPGPLVLTSVAQPLSDVAKAAVEMIAEATGGEPSSPIARLFAPELREGNSCCPPKRP